MAAKTEESEMIDMGLIDVARWWFKHYPSDVFISGEVADIRKQFACLMIRRHENRKNGRRSDDPLDGAA